MGSPAARLLRGKANVYKTCSSGSSLSRREGNVLLSSSGRCASLPGAGVGAALGTDCPSCGLCAGRKGAPAPQSEHVGGRRAENPIRTAGDRLSRRAWCLHAVWHCPACSPVCSSVSPGLLGWTPRTGERSQLAFLSGKSRQSRSRGAFISCWRKLCGLPLRSRSSHHWPRAGLREGKDSLCQRNARGGRPGCSDLPSGQATGRPVLRALCGEACRPWLPGLTRKVAAGGGQCPPPGLPSPGWLPFTARRGQSRCLC